MLHQETKEVGKSFHEEIIDQSISHLLADFHEIALGDAIVALTILSKQEVLPKDAIGYLDLPPILLEERFLKIKESLKMLHRIMQNPQPEKDAKFSEDQGSEIKFGIFGLKNRADLPSKIVHDYVAQCLKRQIWVLKIIDSTVTPMLRKWKNKARDVYRSALLNWIQNDVNGMPDAVKDILNPKNILLISINKKIKKENPSESQQDRNQLANTILKHIFTLTPSLLDPDVQVFEPILILQPMKDENKIHDIQREALKKMKSHLLTQPIEKLFPLASAFIEHEQAYRFLHEHNMLLKYTIGKVELSSIERIITEFFSEIINNPNIPDKIESENLLRIRAFIERIHVLFKDDKLFFFRDYFATYFTSDQHEQKNLVNMVIELHFSEKKIVLSDSMIDDFFANQTIPGVIDVTPYHINRVLLHALMINPSQWSAKFSSILELTIDLLKNNEIKTTLNVALIKHSYPDELIKELEWLLFISRNQINLHTLTKYSNYECPDMIYPLIYFSLHANQILSLYCHLLPFKSIPEFNFAKNRVVMLLSSSVSEWKMERLLPEELEWICTHFKAEMSNLLNDEDTFSTLIWRMSLAQLTVVCRHFKEKILQSISTLDDYLRLTSYSVINGVDVSLVFYDIFKEKMSEWVTSFDMLLKLLQGSHIPRSRCPEFFQRIINKLPDIIVRSTDLTMVNIYLPKEDFLHVFNLIKPNLANIIKSAQDYVSLFHFQNEVLPEVRESLDALLPTIIKTVFDAAFIISTIGRRDPSGLFDHLRPVWLNILKTSLDYFNLMNAVDSQKSLVFNNIKDILPDFICSIETKEELDRVLTLHTPEEKNEIMKMRDKKSDKTKTDLQVYSIYGSRKRKPDQDLEVTHHVPPSLRPGASSSEE